MNSLVISIDCKIYSSVFITFTVRKFSTFLFLNYNKMKIVRVAIKIYLKSLVHLDYFNSISDTPHFANENLHFLLILLTRNIIEKNQTLLHYKTV